MTIEIPNLRQIEHVTLADAVADIKRTISEKGFITEEVSADNLWGYLAQGYTDRFCRAFESEVDKSKGVNLHVLEGADPYNPQFGFAKYVTGDFSRDPNFSLALLYSQNNNLPCLVLGITKKPIDPEVVLGERGKGMANNLQIRYLERPILIKRSISGIGGNVESIPKIAQVFQGVVYRFRQENPQVTIVGAGNSKLLF